MCIGAGVAAAMIAAGAAMADTAQNALGPAGPQAARIKSLFELFLTVAAVGFLFDTYELLMFPVIGADSVAELIRVNPDGSSPGTGSGARSSK